MMQAVQVDRWWRVVCGWCGRQRLGHGGASGASGAGGVGWAVVVRTVQVGLGLMTVV